MIGRMSKDLRTYQLLVLTCLHAPEGDAEPCRKVTLVPDLIPCALVSDSWPRDCSGCTAPGSRDIS